MAQKINIFNDEWCDLLFEERNKGYGAFILRKSSGKRHIMAILVTISVFTLAIAMPTIIKNVMPKRNVKIVEVTNLSNMKMEEKKTEKAKDVVVEEIKKVKAAIKFVPPVIKQDDEIKDTATVRTVDQLSQLKGMISSVDVTGTTDDPDAVDATEVHQILDDSVAPPLTYVEQMPEFPGGGMDALMKYLQKNLRYPEIARDNGASGTVYVQFVVSTTGKVTEAKVVRGFDESCEREALRVIKTMPAWIPGRQNGTAVRVLMSVPVRFKLE